MGISSSSINYESTQEYLRPHHCARALIPLLGWVQEGQTQPDGRGGVRVATGREHLRPAQGLAGQNVQARLLFLVFHLRSKATAYPQGDRARQDRPSCGLFHAQSHLRADVFIAHSFSCREGKGTHKAVDALQGMLRQVSRNGMRHCYALQCDVYKFFDSLDHGILLKLLGQKIKDDDVMRLLAEIINSFSSPRFPAGSGKGVPIGNLTSQLFANIYLHELDHFMKHELRIKPYVRYTDDFVIVHNSRDVLELYKIQINKFLKTIKLELHHEKSKLYPLRNGVIAVQLNNLDIL